MAHAVNTSTIFLRITEDYTLGSENAHCTCPLPYMYRAVLSSPDIRDNSAETRH